MVTGTTISRTWSRQGPQGPQGDPGEQGPQGDPGADGEDGAGGGEDVGIVGNTPGLISDGSMSGAGVTQGTDQRAEIQTILDDAKTAGKRSVELWGNFVIDGLLQIPDFLPVSIQKLYLKDANSGVVMSQRSGLYNTEIFAPDAFLNGVALRIVARGGASLVYPTVSNNIRIVRDYQAGNALQGTGLLIDGQNGPNTFHQVKHLFIQSFDEGLTLDSGTASGYCNSNNVQGWMYNCRESVNLVGGNDFYTSGNYIDMVVQVNNGQLTYENGHALKMENAKGNTIKLFTWDWNDESIPHVVSLTAVTERNEIHANTGFLIHDDGLFNRIHSLGPSRYKHPDFTVPIPLGTNQGTPSLNHFNRAADNPEITIGVVAGQDFDTPTHINRIWHDANSVNATISNMTSTTIEIILPAVCSGLFSIGVLFTDGAVPESVMFEKSSGADAYSNFFTDQTQTVGGRTITTHCPWNMELGTADRFKITFTNTVASTVTVQRIFACLRKYEDPPLFQPLVLDHMQLMAPDGLSRGELSMNNAGQLLWNGNVIS